MIKMDAYLERNPSQATMIMQVHDELVFEVANESLESFKEIVQDLMCHCTDLNVPITVDVGIGDNWDEAH